MSKSGFKILYYYGNRYTIGLKDSRHFFIQSEVKPRNQLQLAHTRFPALCVSYMNLLRLLIGSLDSLRPLICDWP